MVAYTVIIGDYDHLKPVKREHGVKHVCITDNPKADCKGWEIVSISRLQPPKDLTGVRLQRWAKVIGGVKFFKCDTIYVDGSHEIIGNVSELFSHCGDNMALKRHPVRNCYITEAEACKRLGKANGDDIDRQVNANILSGVPGNYGMYETGVLVRRYNSEVLRFCEKWWDEIKRYTHRDQLSVTKALFETGIYFNVFTQKEFAKYLKIHNHK
jgi:hypothetical protein